MVLSLSSLKNRKGLLLLLLLAIVVVIVALAYVGGSKSPLKVDLFQKGPKVSTKTEYTNPFNKDSQYVNPFETYKNPFVVSR